MNPPFFSPRTTGCVFRLSAALGICFTIAAQLSSARAADILRGGGYAAPTGGAASNGTPSAAIALARANAKDALARTSNALKSVKAMQTTARNLALKGPNNLGMNPNHPGMVLPNVPNGLVTGGLKVAPGVPLDLVHPVTGENPALWQGAMLPKQTTTSSGRTKVTIEQTKSQALLTWETFNIGKDTTLAFDQSAGGNNASQWIAFNKILDPSGSPSQILGSIEALGQVYVINQNGIIFGGSSQVNLHTLVASSLPINDNLITRGLLNNPDDQFLFSFLPIPLLPSGATMPAFTPPPPPNTPDGKPGNVVVQAGAQLSSPTTPEHVGGRIALVGPNVTNAGTISTPDGQTILAAGQQVAMLAHASTDPSLRGLDVFIGQGAGIATNATGGLIDAPRADVTIAGKNVQQFGFIDSTTSVALNGRIDLLADYNATPTKDQNNNAFLSRSATGLVTLGPDSVTRILPELDSTETVVGIQLALPSQIKIEGLAIHLAGNSQILAPSANVDLSAGQWLPSSPQPIFVNSVGQIYLDAGASINVAGSIDIEAPVSENIVSVQLLGAELADSPLQRLGLLRGLTIQVDIRQSGIYNGFAWIGTPLANASGYAGLIQRSVGELTTSGGTVKLRAGGAVVIQDGAEIDVSGGWINYQGGVVQTSRIISEGHIFDISQATPDRIYDGLNTGIFTTAHLKWGIAESFTNPILQNGAHFEDGYTYGGNGGAIAISAPSMALDGTLLGNTVSGPRQRAISPGSSSLSLAFEAADATATNYTPHSPTPPAIVFKSGVSQTPADAFALDTSGMPEPLRADRTNSVILAPELLSDDGFGALTIQNGDGSIKVPADVSLTTTPGGSVTLAAANLDIAGQIVAPGGSLNFTAFDFSPYAFAALNNSATPTTPDADPTRGHFTLASTALLSTAGLVVDDRPVSPTAQTLPMLTNGGSIAITSFSASLAAGSVLDVSGGVAFSAAAKRTYGNGGSILIKTGQDADIPSIVGGKLTLGATLEGFSGAKGGSLTLQATAIRIGDGPARAGILQLAPDFFSEGGFSSFTINGLGAAKTDPNQFVPAIVIEPGTVLAPMAESLLAEPDANTGESIVLSRTLLPVGVRTPVSLSFGARGVTDQYASTVLVARGDFVMGAGAVIEVDPRASVSISGNTVALLGSIYAPGGSITIAGVNTTAILTLNNGIPLPNVDLAPHSVLSTAGTTLLIPDPRGFHTGVVLPGGSISVSGNVVAEAGALLDVSGASDTLDFLPAYSGLTGALGSMITLSLPVPTEVDSNGGAITFKGDQELFMDATLRGGAGGVSAVGGSLTISSGRFIALTDSTKPTPLDITMTVTQGGLTIPVPFYPAGQTAIGHAVVDANGHVLSAGHFAADRFNTSGLDALAIDGTVQFSGPVSIRAPRSISVADAGVMFADAAVNLTAPYVALGMPFQPPILPGTAISVFLRGTEPFYFAPTFGTGRLTVDASLIDIGNLSLQDIGNARFIADGGDIRGDGILDVAGNIYMRAGQVYPATGVSFTIAAYDYTSNGTAHSGSVTFARSGDRELPLSAGGELNVYASTITQGGVLRAPIGTINLGWDGTGTGPKDLMTNGTFASAKNVTLTSGSVTSVSAIDPRTGDALIIPYGTNPDGTSWLDPAGLDITTGGVPGKTITIAAANVADQAGATIDIRGGGDLYAYRFVTGLGGSHDLLASSSSFAILPGYAAGFAPYDAGYANSTLSVGDRIYLNGGNGFAAGFYTLLPARYALLPGAFLVTPKSGTPVGSVTLPDGSSLVSGYRFNDLNAERTGTPLNASFEVASSAVVRQRAQYDDFFANTYLRQSAIDHDAPIPRLPIDSGQLVLAATQSMAVQGTVSSQSVGGRGGLVDVSSPVDILIAGPGVTGGAGMLVLDARQLSAIGAESLLIGGVRHDSADGTTVTVQTGSLTVDNAGAALTGNDIILVANKSLTLAPDAVVEQTGTSSGQADTLLFGNANVAGSGNGVLLRVSSDPTAQIVRSGVSASTIPTMTIGAGARIAGASLTLDSTYATSLDPGAHLNGEAIALNSGRVSLELDNPGTLQPTTGLVLSSSALQSLQAGARELSLLSYSSIDIYGTGQIGDSSVASVALHAAEIRGFNNGGGTVKFAARNITLDNSANGTMPGPLAGLSQGTLEFDANVIRLGTNQLDIDQFATVALHASGGVLAQGEGGFAAQHNLDITAPLVTASAGATHTIDAGGALSILAPTDSTGATIAGGLGASLSFTGASISANSDIILPSGELTLHATNGDVQIGNLAASRLDVGGIAQTFFDLVKYTDGGHIDLLSDGGNVQVAAGSVVTVAAAAAGGDGGSLSVGAAKGSFTAADGVLLGGGGAQGQGGSFTLDVGSLASTQALDAALNDAAFTEARAIRVRTGDVTIDGTANVHSYSLSADQGAIDVTGTIDASGTRGGTIHLAASGSLTLETGAELTVAAQKFDAAGKGGAVTLEAGVETNGVTNAGASLDIQAGSTIDLSVAANSATSAGQGDFTGTLHLRAPQTAGGTDLQIGAINGTILNASSIVVEGFHVFDLTVSGGAINSGVQTQVRNNGVLFAGNTAVMSTRLLANNAGLANALSIQPGAEIINRSGDLTLGTLTSTESSDWDLETYRFGPDNAPGVLTLRASGNLVFFNALSDGFTPNPAAVGTTALLNSYKLMDQNSALPLNAQSWSYRLAAGADFGAADFHDVMPYASLTAGSGSLLLGKNAEKGISVPSGTNATTNSAVLGHYQVIRTGTGDIDIAAGRDVQLLNQFATIYTAGVKVADPTMGGTFDLPILNAAGSGSLGAIQEPTPYPVQYSFGGGNVTLEAGGDIAHYTRNTAGTLIADSERELPMNWLFRRGFVNPTTGQFGVAKFGDVASTTWWIDYANFFEGVGALGGGNVSMTAGRDISNVDGLVPTNARMPKGAPDATKLVELGGGDLFVQAGRNLDGGVYYVERGQGVLSAGNEITTNSTRSPSLTNITIPPTILPEQTWLPTTLFAGKASFDVSARGDLLLGPVANPFLLPEGYSNTYWYKTYFSTYGLNDAVNVSSLTGDVTLRESAALETEVLSGPTPLLKAWLQNVMLFPGSSPGSSFYQPWLRLDETNVTPFTTVAALLPGTLRVTAFSGAINLVGNLTLSPSPRGTVDLAAGGSINGLQINGVAAINGTTTNEWATSQINLSDANPDAVPGIASPFAYQAVVGTAPTARTTGDIFLTFVDNLFTETGSTQGAAGVLQTKQALHAQGGLHTGDLDPVHLYAEDGDISGFTLFAGKTARVVAGHDVTDIALYVQNLDVDDVSVVAAGRDIVAYDNSSPLRAAAQAPGNVLNSLDAGPSGDLQINGPGTFEVLAGRNLDLGVGPNNADGTGVGLTSIGNARNPALPFEGADVIAGAGVGGSYGLNHGALDFTKFIGEFLEPGSVNATRYLPALGELLNLSSAGEAQVWAAFQKLPEESRDSLALDIFYLVLRDAGRDHNIPDALGFGTYAAGFDAIDALFPGSQWSGDIETRSRDIRTKSGGNIDLFAPGGALTLATSIIGNPLAPPGIITEDGGNISIFTDGNVDIGISRIFTLRGGNEVIWSSNGNIAAGSSSKTVQSAPPTRVVIDPQSGDVKTDLAGLATGGGIGVLASVVGVPPGDVDLIAPGGTIDAGDAGIRVSGNINIAAVQVLNASNIQASGASSGVPTTSVAAPNISGLTTASNTAAAGNSAAEETAKQARTQTAPQEETPSIISVEVLGYGGGEGGSSDDEEERRKKKEAEEQPPQGQAALPPKGSPPLASRN